MSGSRRHIKVSIEPSENTLSYLLRVGEVWVGADQWQQRESFGFLMIFLLCRINLTSRWQPKQCWLCISQCLLCN